MKNRKWLLVILLIVLIVNVLFFVLVRLAGVDKIVQKKFSDYISKQMDAKVLFSLIPASCPDRFV